ncbi:MAG: hypothetical protein IJG86_06050 [Clostridia bacterium]|nr:hypothetical protein [Clostridia bacterium]
MTALRYPAFPAVLEETRKEWVPVYPDHPESDFFVIVLDGETCTVAIGSRCEEGAKKLSILVVHTQAWERDFVQTGRLDQDPELAAFSKRHSVCLAVVPDYSAATIDENPRCFTEQACAVIATAKAAEFIHEKQIDEPFWKLVTAFYFDALCEGVLRAKGELK